ncbi:hypothetical protein ACLMJK_005392 [Lecanora helva]
MNAAVGWKPPLDNRNKLGQSPRVKGVPTSPVKRDEEENNLQVKAVIGTTTKSASAFDADPETHAFVCCAGSAVVLYYVNEDLSTTQRVLCARPNISPINATLSFYNPSTPPTTPTRSRHGASIKATGLQMGSAASTEQIPNSQSHGGANKRSREATSVSLSREGKLLAVGEGEICLLDDTGQKQQIKLVARVGFDISCVTFDRHSGLVWLAGEDGITQSIVFDNLMERATTPPGSPLRKASSTTQEKRPSILAIGIVRDQLVTVSPEMITIGITEEISKSPSAIKTVKRLQAHGDAVLGVCRLSPKAINDHAEFLTFSKNGKVLFWKLSGICVKSIEIPLDQSSDEDADNNELKTLMPSTSGNFLVSGDIYGILRLVDVLGNTIVDLQAHVGGINSVAIGERGESKIIASCGRDRTIQVFHKDENDLAIAQTMNDHAASVTDLIFSDQALGLFSISSDRTISIRKWACTDQGAQAYICVRMITLKASPVSFAMTPDENVVVVSTTDKQIQSFDISSGQLLHSFKVADSFLNESIVMNSLSVVDHGETDIKTRLLISTSSNDRSIRVHDLKSGSLLAKDYGQSALSAVRSIEPSDNSDLRRLCLVSCGYDGIVMIWALSFPNGQVIASSAGSNSNDSPIRQGRTPTHPERRFVSKSEISSLQKTLERDDDTFTPLQDFSTKTSRRKTARSSLASTPHQSARSHLAVFDTPSLFSNGKRDTTSPENDSLSVPSKPRNPRLTRRQSKSAANLNDLNDAAKDIAHSLQNFRARISSAAIDKLDTVTAQELEKELEMTNRALRERTCKTPNGSEITAADPFDVYIAKMIDERLALRAKPNGDRNDRETPAGLPNADQQPRATTGLNEVSTELS